VIRTDVRMRLAAVFLLVALLASLAVAGFRLRTESQTRRVEIAMDYTEFLQLARSFNYNPSAFLIALRRAGLTSLALTEELGSGINDQGNAFVATGAALLNQARLGALAQPSLARLARERRIDRDAVYLVVYDPATFARYRAQLALRFEPKTVRVLSVGSPWIIEVRTQIDYFDAVGLGIPADHVALAKKLGLLVIPRFQNDERFAQPQIAALVEGVLHQDRLVSTLVFFGLRNQVVGYPDHLPDMAAVFKMHGMKSPRPLTFGSIEAYDDSQIQKGSETLARLIPGQTVRVQAIGKTELDKITLDETVARYVLGVRERNIRVVYLHPWLHRDGDLTIEATNVEMVKAIADEVKAGGFRLGRATPIPLYRGNNAILVGLAALGVPSIFVLLLGALGVYRRGLALAAYGATIALYAAGLATHHDLLARSVIALVGAVVFAAASFFVLAPAFSEEPASTVGRQLVRSVGWTLAVTGVALLGALIVIGLLSAPLMMEEIERFRGVKLVLALPPLIALALYVFSGRFNAGAKRAGDVFLAPVQVYQLLAGIVIVGAGALLVMRSGNQSDIAPSALELSLRHSLTTLLAVRPRFKEFLVGVPLLMLVPALSAAHRRALGWVFALGIGVGIGDVIDTFSHLHTPLSISLLRVANGVAIGVAVGIVAIMCYRALRARVAA